MLTTLLRRTAAPKRKNANSTCIAPLKFGQVYDNGVFVLGNSNHKTRSRYNAGSRAGLELDKQCGRKPLI
jgi:hypothetical protein